MAFALPCPNTESASGNYCRRHAKAPDCYSFVGLDRVLLGNARDGGHQLHPVNDQHQLWVGGQRSLWRRRQHDRHCNHQLLGREFQYKLCVLYQHSNFVNFDLYQNSAHTTEWGNYTNSYLGGGNQTSFTSNSSGNISNKTITVYAVLDGSQQTAIPGSYSETMSGSSSNELQYGSTSGNCPTGSHTSQYSFTVSATLVAGCNVSATTLNFGSSGVLASAVNQTSTVTATCTSTTPYNIGLNAGNGSGSTVTTRKMTGSGGATINYSLYSNSTRTTNWGNTVGTDTVAGTGSGVAQNYTVYGQVPAQTTPAPATYSDTVVVTVTF